MRKNIGLVIVILGGLLVLSAFAVSASNDTPAPTTVAAPVAQTSPEGATYVGSTTCFQCHSNYYRNWDSTLHSEMVKGPEASVADFAAGGDMRMVEGTPYDLEDVTYVLGNKYSQRFVQQTDAGYTVLPGIWQIQAQQWVEAEATDWVASCAGCHTTGYEHSGDAATWAELNITCEACHGPGSGHVELASALPEGVDPNSEEVYAVRQAIVSTVDSAVCGQCHSQGMSADGAHPFPVDYQAGGTLDDSVYTLAQPVEGEDSDLFWPNGSEKAYRTTYNVYINTAHANALPTITDNDHAGEFCLACHSTDFAQQDRTFAQDAVTLENAQFGITCVQCHAPHGGSPGVEAQLRFEAYDLCVSCHTGTSLGQRPIVVGDEVHHPMREMFEGSSFLDLEPNPSPHFANEAYGPICSSCHMVPTTQSPLVGHAASHTFQVILPTENAEGQPDSCTGCHNPEHDPDATPESLFFYVEEVQADTQERVEDINADLEEITAAHPDWDPEAQDKPEEQLLAERIHTLVSFVEADGSWGFHNPGYADDILSEAEDLLDELLDMVEE